MKVIVHKHEQDDVFVFSEVLELLQQNRAIVLGSCAHDGEGHGSVVQVTCREVRGY